MKTVTLAVISAFLVIDLLAGLFAFSYIVNYRRNTSLEKLTNHIVEYDERKSLTNSEIYRTFEACEDLTNVVPDVRPLTNITTIWSVFMNCRHLTNYPPSLEHLKVWTNGIKVRDEDLRPYLMKSGKTNTPDL